MARKLGIDAFEHYFALGAGRSYQAVADRFGVSKRAVTDLAKRERWQEQVAEREQQVRASAEQKAVETMEQMNDRHLTLLKAMGARAVHALKEHPLSTGMEAIRAAETVIKMERLVAGDATQRTAVTVEQVTRQEIDRLVATDADGDAESGDDAGSADAEGGDDSGSADEDW